MEASGTRSPLTEGASAKPASGSKAADGTAPVDGIVVPAGDSSAIGVDACVFAHNEEDEIARSVAAVLGAFGEAAKDDGPRVHVVVNGSRDRTAAIVREMAEGDGRIVLHELSVGDKSNAWDHYVHELADPARHHAFVDGDVRPEPGAIARLAAGLRAHPGALAASALPVGGRTSGPWAERILVEAGLPGNLYMLRDATVRRMREEGFRLPIGLIGDDTLLRFMLLRDLDGRGTPDKARIAPVRGAFFRYESLPWSMAGVRERIARQRRYALRDLQMALIDAHWREGKGGLPHRIADLYGGAGPLTARHRAPRMRWPLMPGAWLKARRAWRENEPG